MATQTHPWRSERLIYRAPESSDDAFISSSHASLLDASPLLPTPRATKTGTAVREMLEKRLIGVVICLPAQTADGAFDGDSAGTSGAGTAATIPIGTMGLTAPDPNQWQHQTSKLGMLLHPSYHHQGYGTEALGWLLRFAFHSANLHRVELSVFEWNTRAINLYEKAGFILEGRRRQSLWYEGRWWDYLEYGMLAEDWREAGQQKDREVEIALATPLKSPLSPGLGQANDI